MIGTIINWIRQNITRRPRKVGDRNGAPVYRGWCPLHGYFEDIARGWDVVLRCPTCSSDLVGGV